MSGERPITKNKNELKEFLKTLAIGTGYIDLKVTNKNGLSIFVRIYC
jgi:hypothetical protein